MPMASLAATNDPRTVVDESRMTTRMWIIVAVMVLLNANDGFDVLSSAFAAPGISAEWGIPRSELGVMLGAELVGMGFGSVLLGGLADRMGRKPTILICLVIGGIGMFLASQSAGVWDLTAFRFITGIGIGGMLASINAVTAECTNKKDRSLAMSLMVIGYPLGAVLGGLVAAELLQVYTWRSMFVFGGIITIVCVPLVLFLVPETPAYYVATRREGALDKINRSLRFMRLQPIGGMPAAIRPEDKPKITDILAKPALRKVTLLLGFGYMFHTFTFYYILKFAPQIVADFGYSPSEAATVLVWANVGGSVGGFIFGFLMRKWDIKGPTIAMLILAAVAVAAFGIAKDTLWGWRMATFITGFTTNAAIVGYYAAYARGFPAYARATGTGFVLGIGRFGAAGSPVIAGLLFTYLGNDQLLPVSIIMAAGSLIAAYMLFVLPLKDGDKEFMGKIPAGEAP
jgi:benzoate transport